MADVLIVIDALYDFLNPNGIFARHFGIVSCQPLLDLRTTLNDIICTMESKNKPIVLVGSEYQNTQFGTKDTALSMLCTTQKGREIVLNKRTKNTIIMTKTTNYILDCTDQIMKRKLLGIIQNKRVLICGVTLSHCIQKSAIQLVQYCQQVIVARNGVASRKKYSHEASSKIYQTLTNKGVKIIDNWQDLFNTTDNNDEHINEWRRWLIVQHRGLS
eukprot:177531_1